MNQSQSTDRRVYGIHSAMSMLQQSPRQIHRVLLAEGFHGNRLKRIREEALRLGIRVSTVPRSTLDRLARGATHQGVLLETVVAQAKSEQEFEQEFEQWKNPFILVMDGVLDPRNLGACLRVAAAAGVDAVLIGKNRSAPLTEVVHRTSTGALDSVFLVQVSNLARRLDWLKDHGCWVVGTQLNASNNYLKADFVSPTVVVVGGEEKGLRQLTRAKCDHLVSIPMFGNVESLNVSVATGILLYEVQRQRAGELGRTESAK
ncbi:MAG: 23S rRNA (guanosine(2251)-2'-O)-methyltransferase RlmB [Gammaproteobacteria bacterium]|nr:23S rRNA (guanosine(2251)-2'-O)-methyltransferase RlmB [Gammaproteobacteria bacterium]